MIIPVIRIKKSIKRLFNAFGLEITRLSPATPTAKPVEDILATLDMEYRSTLLSLYHGEPQPGIDGKLHPINNVTRISPSQGIWLYNLCLSVKPRSTLEIGLAYGYSTLYFLAAISKNQAGTHIAIDPFECSDWHGIGLVHANTHAPGPDSVFRYIEDRSDFVATDLARSNSNFDIIFIDGSHRFDDVLVDFYLYAPLCTLGGYIVFDDMWMSSIRTVVAFIRTNRRDFIEIPTNEHNICAFRKVGCDSRKWDEFYEFVVARTQTGKIGAHSNRACREC